MSRTTSAAQAHLASTWLNKQHVLRPVAAWHWDVGCTAAKAAGAAAASACVGILLVLLVTALPLPGFSGLKTSSAAPPFSAGA
jgi:hypothetical protein